MKKILIWIFAVIITLSAAVYQRLTGPTHPKRCTIELGGKEYKVKFLRSQAGSADAEIALNIPDTNVHAMLVYRLFPSNFEWSSCEMEHKEGKLVGYLPNQPMAGKIEYYMQLTAGNEKVEVMKNETIKIRFRGEVPDYILIPHIFFMFIFMLFANAAGLFAIAKIEVQRLYGIISLILIIIGGMILGPLVQKFAFNEYWAGVPFAWDLTDNKTLIALIFWIIAVAANYKKPKMWTTILAAVVTIIVFSIPHSMFGSELDHESGKIIQGFITPFFRLY